MATTITASKSAPWTPARPFRRPSMWLTALVLSAAVGALLVWMLVARSGDQSNTAKSPVTNVHTVRDPGQAAAICRPAPGTRYC